MRGPTAIQGAFRPPRRDNGVVARVPGTGEVTVRDGTRLRTVEWSSPSDSPGARIVLVHGLASNARLWDGAARELARRGHAVTAIDLRGHGLSDKPDAGYSVHEVADDVRDAIVALHGSARVIAIGQSWGGNLVVELAARHAGHLRGVVAVDGGTIDLARAFPDWDECRRTLSPPNLEGMSYDRLRSYIRAAHPDWSDEGIDGQMANMEHRADGTIKPWLTLERHLLILRGLWEHSPSALWPRIEVPVLFTPAAKSDDDHVRAKRRQLGDALATLPRARVEWFEPADHDLHAQFPDRFASVVDDAIATGFFA